MGLFSRSEPATHFPDIEGRRLDGTPVSFPSDLPADATLLVVSFQDDVDPLADQWARLGDRIAENHGDRVASLELPVVGKTMRVLGDLATMGIRGQVQGEAERARTVPVFVDKKKFCKALRLRDKSDVYAFLVARDGRIAWRGEGDIDMDEVVALEQAVQDVLDAPPLADEVPEETGTAPSSTLDVVAPQADPSETGSESR